MGNLSAAFFTEAGSKRGMGHLVRSYTLYEKFRQEEAAVDFFLDSDLNYDHQFEDIKYFKFSELTIKQAYDVIFIDSYEADLEIYKALSKAAKITVYIDDYERLKYPAGIVINFAPDAKKLYFKKTKKGRETLLGLKYLPIREEILKAKIEKENQIFIMLGGADIKGLSLKIIKSLKDVPIKKVIVINDPKLLGTMKDLKDTEILHKPSNEVLVQNMAKSSLAITTASMSLYELHYLKTKTVIVAINENQESGEEQLIKHKLASMFIDLKSDQWEKEIAQEVTALSKKRDEITSFIDGKGVERIYSQVLQRLRG